MKKLIFFVDDDKMILNLLEYTLNNREDYDIKTFQRGEDCLKEIDSNPELIVLDHYFEETSEKFQTGLDILKEVKNVAPNDLTHAHQLAVTVFVQQHILEALDLTQAHLLANAGLVATGAIYQAFGEYIIKLEGEHIVQLAGLNIVKLDGEKVIKLPSEIVIIP